jgi:predicted DNA-binding protein
MRLKKIFLPEELHEKLIYAFSTSLGIRKSVVERSIESFITDLLDYLSREPEKLRELLSSDEKKSSCSLPKIPGSST